jgi:transglutaminase-like putative cysteine protease
VPLSIAVLAVASFGASPTVRWTQVAGALFGLAYLWVVLRRVEPATGVGPGARRWGTLAVFAAVAGTIAVLLIRFLPWAQPHVEDAAATLLNPSFSVAQAGFSANSKLGDIEQLSLSRTVVLRVWTPAPRKLRARVLTQFDGRTWHAPRPAWADLPVVSTRGMPEDLAGWLAALPGTSFGDATAARRPEQTRMRVAQAVVVADTLFAPVGVAIAHVRGSRLRSNRFGVFEAPADPIGMYALVHAPVAASLAGEADAETLAVSDDVDPRLRALAGTLATDDPTPAVKIARTVSHLARECRYSLDAGPFRSRQPVAEFLFEKKRGYCEYFASAAAILLRLQGVPARYVTGFSMDAAEAASGHYVVRESDAHAWIEAWIPERGWVEVDPTPAGDYAAVHAPRGGLFARLGEWLKARWAEAALAVRTGELRWLASAVGVPLAAVVSSIVAVFGLRRWRRRRRSIATVARAAGWNGDPELARVMARLDALWARHGHARPPHRAPLEHLRSAPPGRLPASLEAASADVIACYYDSRYGGLVPAPETVRGLARRLEDHPS